VSREIPVLQVQSFANPFSATVLEELSCLLPAYISEQRWFRSKARTIRTLKIEDAIEIPKSEAFVLITRLDYSDGEADHYLLALSSARTSNEIQKPDVVARLRDSNQGDRVLRNALADSDFRQMLLNAIACNERFLGRNSEMIASRTTAFTRKCDSSEPKLDSFISRAEQSNSSLVFGDQYILKLFRKLEPGVNPDLEICRYLTEQHFRYTPPVLGAIEYRPRDGEPMHAGILQGFVKNRGDAWRYTLESLSGFFERALANGRPPASDTYHPMALASEELPAAARQTIGEYIESARLLGNRTALMHAALANPSSGPDFAPQSVSLEYAQHLHHEMLEQAQTTFELLDDKLKMLSGEAAEDARNLLAARSRVRDRFDSLLERPIGAVRIRHHGDYHLGQVLFTGDDFVIIDFEGEPARPLAHRRIKTLAMRDVAGMIRSFSYAGYAALFGQVAGVPTDSGSRDEIEAWAAYWGAWASAEFLKAYFETANNAAFAGSDPQEQRDLFDTFVLQKALYEVAYELNNRPDWVEIPLRGILSLVG
jgi:maltose alpha-D-glucosyltransferase / alpha-amylase